MAGNGGAKRTRVFGTDSGGGQSDALQVRALEDAAPAGWAAAGGIYFADGGGGWASADLHGDWPRGGRGAQGVLAGQPALYRTGRTTRHRPCPDGVAQGHRSVPQPPPIGPGG